MAELTTEQFAAAVARGAAHMRGPRAESAHYDADRNRVIVRLTTGVEIGFAPGRTEGLARACVDDLKVIEVQAFGLGIHFPALDADLYVPALLKRVLGSKSWMAAQLALKGEWHEPSKAVGSADRVKRVGRPQKAAGVGDG